MLGGLLMVAMCVWTTSAAMICPLATPRCASPVLLASHDMPSTSLPPMAVVEHQLAALKRGEVQSCFDFSSSRFRRVTGPRQRFEKIVRQAPEYKPLVDCSDYEILSALQIGPQRWKCRVRVDNVVGRMPFSVEYRWELTRQSETDITYDLGQCMVHKKYGYRGLIVGWDHECRQSDEWCETMEVDKLTHGRAQPFYHVLVDRRDRPGGQMTYVAQESIEGTAIFSIDHPYFKEATFTGEVDQRRGTWKPNPLLREQYPLGLEGCWLVDHVFPDKVAERTFDA